MDNVLIDKLIEVLDIETEMYKSILKLSKSKTDVIVEGKITELESITRLEQTLILNLGKLEGEREQLVDQIAAQLNMKASDITLSRLGKLLPKEQSARLANCHKTLPLLLHELSDANGLNAKLIKNSLDYIDFSVNLMTSVASTGNNYGNAGQTGDSKKRNFFDMKL